MIRVKRIYEPLMKTDGLRVLVERLWPRGFTKSRAKVDLWLKDLAPSAALRTWFGHDPAKWPTFRRRYQAELARYPDVVARLRAKAAEGPVTLLFAARDERHNSAIVLREVLARGSPGTGDDRQRTA